MGIPDEECAVRLPHYEKLEIGEEEAADGWQGKKLVFEQGCVLGMVQENYISVQGTLYNPIFILEKRKIKNFIRKPVKLINDIPTGKIQDN